MVIVEFELGTKSPKRKPTEAQKETVKQFKKMEKPMICI
jgi:hypothetical protein